MTDQTTPMSAEEAAGRALVARTTFEKEAVWLPMLAVQHWNAGEMSIKDKTFTDCVIEGPAVMAVMNGTFFDGHDDRRESTALSPCQRCKDGWRGRRFELPVRALPLRAGRLHRLGPAAG